MPVTPPTSQEPEFWLFGYGFQKFDLETPTTLRSTSPTIFPSTFTEQQSDRRIPGYVTGYVRRFWQASQDHRGTPSAPGRVVTLIERSFWDTLTDPHPSGSHKVWGTAYRIAASKVDEVRAYLDIREINGYSIHYTPFHPADNSSSIRTLVYIGTPDNEQFTGPQDPDALAEHIYRSEGPSGLNKDYLLSLETALDGLSTESGDGHVSDLARRVRKLELEESKKAHSVDSEGLVLDAIDRELRKADSTDEQEETEK